MRKEQLVLAGSHGGHLGQVIRLRAELLVPSYVVTTDNSREVHCKSDMATVTLIRTLRSWIRNAFESAMITAQLRPTLVVSFGSRDVAFFCLWSKLLGARLMLVESFARVGTPSRFLRAFSPLANRILVQWPGLLHRFPNATLVHPVFSVEGPVLGQIQNILVAVGTAREGMDRLLRYVDEVSPFPGNPTVVCQIGGSNYIPQKATWFRWMPADEFRTAIYQADLVITHDGSGTVAQALEARKPVIVVPRTPHELDYQGNAELAIELSRQGWVTLARSAPELLDAIKLLPSLTPEHSFSGATVASCVMEELRMTKRTRLIKKASRSDTT